MLSLVRRIHGSETKEIRTIADCAGLRHIAIIMDGNGRWAAKRGLPRSVGHLRGVHTVRMVIEQALSRGVRNLTLFAFSTENWQRSPYEVAFILKLLERYLKNELKNLTKNGTRLQVLGQKRRLPQVLQDAVLRAENHTANQFKMNLNLAISYGGQNEIAGAARTLAEACVTGKLEFAEINQELFARHLSLPDLPPVDLLIRTGGEKRISNFLLWQIAYAELIFLPVLWPDFDKALFLQCIEEFGRRNRRFGTI